MFCMKNLLIPAIIRTIPRNYSRALITDPGIGKRRKIVDAQEDLEELEDLNDLESDFMDIHNTHKEHVREVEAMEERIKYLMVKQKYFKTKLPNFLSWQDKEQIKFLHSTNPEEWTVEKLSESFPALPEVVRKIIKSNFSKTESRIANHDGAVRKNWESFKKGNMPDLPQDLVEHLNKFTSRELNLTPFKMPSSKKEIVVKQSAPSEFSEIITSYEKLKNKNKDQQDSAKCELTHKKKLFGKNEHEDTSLMSNKRQIKGKPEVTLSELQHQIENQASVGKTLSEDEKLLLKNFKQQTEEKNVAHVNQVDITDVSPSKYQSAGVSNKTQRDYSHLIYPEKIIIPFNKVKKGYTYRLNDCYYDYDGQFLYRVPGMG